MMLKLLVPGVKDAEETDLSAKMSGIFRDFQERLGTAPEQQAVDDLFVLQGQWRQFVRKSENDMGIARGQQFGAARGDSEATPIVVNDVMYLPGTDRVVALEPETGKEIWSFPVNGVSRRGVAYMPGEGSNPPRILFAAGRRLIALNATTGKLDPGFGKEGEVDMVVPYNSVPLIFRNVVVVGANTPPGPLGAPGNARAYDARTGAKLWEFSSIAQPGEPGHGAGPTGAASRGIRRLDTLSWSLRMRARSDGSRKLTTALHFPTTGPRSTVLVPDAATSRFGLAVPRGRARNHRGAG
jgi:outer membrane protein assembly factor BamB